MNGYACARRMLGTMALLACAGLAWAGPPAKVVWDVEAVEEAIAPGATATRVVGFTVDRAVAGVSISTTPSLEGVVAVSPAALSNLVPGQTYPVTLELAAPPAGEVRGGVLQVREGARVLARPLPVKAGLAVIDDGLPRDDEYGPPGSPARVVMEGADARSFNAVGAQIAFRIEGGTFNPDPDAAKVYRNGWPLAPDRYAGSATQVDVLGQVLQEGRNRIALWAEDGEGRTLEHEVVLWAGSRLLRVRVEDAQGQALANAQVDVVLGDDEQVRYSGLSDAQGMLLVPDVPARTLILEGRADGGLFGSTAVNGADGTVRLRLFGFNAPSPVDNNDFSQGLDGWDVGDAPVSLGPHVASTPGLGALAHPPQGVATATERPQVHAELATGGMAPFFVANATHDLDLTLSTRGEGPQRISRTFNARAGARSITVRYRFITTEVPGGYFGTQYNDYYNVTIRSQTAGGIVSESRTMNGLGLSAFDPAGATDWRETTLAIDEQGDVIQVELTVANVADGLLDSYLAVDLIEEPLIAITELTLRDIDGTALTFLSADEHTYFGGVTRVHGTITVEGPEDDALDSLVLEVVQGGGVVATAELEATARGNLIASFGSAERVRQSPQRRLFDLAAGDAAAVDSSDDGEVLLRVRAVSAGGDEVVREAGSVGILARYDGANRYGGRDAAVGGDDWAQPSMLALVNAYAGQTWGDFSNMNGGPFPPHGSHRTGLDADGWFPGYNARNAATAQTIIDQLNQAEGVDIERVYVTYARVDSNVFWTSIRDVDLDDGRRARDVILPEAGHATHYHWRKRAP